MPVGVILGELRPKMLMIGDILWFPWASPRNRLESVLAFVNSQRDEITIVVWSRFGLRKSWEHVCKYAVMRRIGTIMDVSQDGDPMALYQSRKRSH